MSKLLDEAVAQTKKLPEAEQDVAAEALLSAVHKDAPRYRLSPEQVEDVKRIQREIRAGTMPFATDERLPRSGKSAVCEAALFRRGVGAYLGDSRLPVRAKSICRDAGDQAHSGRCGTAERVSSHRVCRPCRRHNGM
jgi:hypothetical protein